MIVEIWSGRCPECEREHTLTCMTTGRLDVTPRLRCDCGLALPPPYVYLACEDVIYDALDD